MNFEYKKIVLIQTSACIAESVTYPIDYIKTLLQVNSKKLYFSTVFSRIIKSENTLQVYDGLSAALVRHSIYTMLRINIYESLRNSIDSDKKQIGFYNKYLIGGISGGTAQLIASPCDLLKIRYITNIHTNGTQSLFATMKQICNENGIRGLWKGVTPNVSRAVLVNFGELATYDQSKQYFKKKLEIQDSTPLHMISSLCSGFVASVCCTPADVIKSRMMQSNSPYTGIGNCIHKTVTEEGVMSLYKGFFPIWFRLAPWQLIFWVSYERLRILSGLESF